MTGLGVGYGFGEEVLGFCFVEFLAEFGVAGGVFEEVVDYCAEGDCGRVAPGETGKTRQIGNITRGGSSGSKGIEEDRRQG